jgi:hypothetical protein
MTEKDDEMSLPAWATDPASRPGLPEGMKLDVSFQRLEQV